MLSFVDRPSPLSVHPVRCILAMYRQFLCCICPGISPADLYFIEVSINDVSAPWQWLSACRALQSTEFSVGCFERMGVVVSNLAISMSQLFVFRSDLFWKVLSAPKLQGMCVLRNSNIIFISFKNHEIKS
jgi:hypothetical protein